MQRMAIVDSSAFCRRPLAAPVSDLRPTRGLKSQHIKDDVNAVGALRLNSYTLARIVIRAHSSAVLRLYIGPTIISVLRLRYQS